MTTTTMSQTSPELPTPDELGALWKWRCEMASGRAIRKRAPFTIQLAVLHSTPELTARVAS